MGIGICLEGTCNKSIVDLVGILSFVNFSITSLLRPLIETNFKQLSTTKHSFERCTSFLWPSCQLFQSNSFLIWTLKMSLYWYVKSTNGKVGIFWYGVTTVQINQWYELISLFRRLRTSNTVILRPTALSLQQSSAATRLQRNCSCSHHYTCNRTTLFALVQPQLDFNAPCCSVEQLNCL